MSAPAITPDSATAAAPPSTSIAPLDVVRGGADADWTGSGRDSWSQPGERQALLCFLVVTGTLKGHVGNTVGPGHFSFAGPTSGTPFRMTVPGD